MTPGTSADVLELTTIADAMGAASGAVFEAASDLAPGQDEFAWMDHILDQAGCKVTFARVHNDDAPLHWQRLLARASRRAGNYPQVAIRPPGLLMCLEGSHPLRRPAELPRACRSAAGGTRC